MSTKNHYQVLEIDSKADLETIKRAYRALIRQHHPDQYAAQLAKMQRGGDHHTISKLEHEIDRAKQTTQRINEAYAILSDAEARQRYDRKLAEDRAKVTRETAIRRREETADLGRRTVKERPHRPRTNQQGEKLPWALMAVFVVILLFATSAFSQMIDYYHVPFTTYVPSQPTAQGIITSNDLQLTTNAEQATVVARTEWARQPTITPRAALDNARTAQTLYEMGSYQHALELVSRAILELPQRADLYYQRALISEALFLEGDRSMAESALADFDQALRLDAMLFDVYRERGLLYYAMWQADGESTLATRARTDLQAYLGYQSNRDDRVQQALIQLGN